MLILLVSLEQKASSSGNLVSDFVFSDGSICFLRFES